MNWRSVRAAAAHAVKSKAPCPCSGVPTAPRSPAPGTPRESYTLTNY
ncbi:MAG: hypothetical protein IKC03_09100 [Oscillospiraceae bacterium]|nr:hypothetical protein [Oscillospiraceae bacterium]